MKARLLAANPFQKKPVSQKKQDVQAPTNTVKPGQKRSYGCELGGSVVALAPSSVNTAATHNAVEYQSSPAR